MWFYSFWISDLAIYTAIALHSNDM
jgi:hypothetical protein